MRFPTYQDQVHMQTLFLFGILYDRKYTKQAHNYKYIKYKLYTSRKYIIIP